MCKEHVLLFKPIAIAKRAHGSRQARQAKGRWVRQQHKHAELRARPSRDFLRSGCAGQGAVSTKKIAPPVAFQPAGEFKCHNVGIFHLKPLVK